VPLPWAGRRTPRPSPSTRPRWRSAGELVLPVLSALDRGGVLVIAGIYLSDVPPLLSHGRLTGAAVLHVG
jgi:alcohol dehydrogenase, propanol-preferring